VKYTESRSFDVPINVLDISRARKDLNWKPTVSFQEGIARVYAWMQKEYKGLST
jgi:UDP-glucose 4-epimerase